MRISSLHRKNTRLTFIFHKHKFSSSIFQNFFFLKFLSHLATSGLNKKLENFFFVSAMLIKCELLQALNYDYVKNIRTYFGFHSYMYRKFEVDLFVFNNKIFKEYSKLIVLNISLNFINKKIKVILPTYTETEIVGNNVSLIVSKHLAKNIWSASHEKLNPWKFLKSRRIMFRKIKKI